MKARFLCRQGTSRAVGTKWSRHGKEDYLATVDFPLLPRPVLGRLELIVDCRLMTGVAKKNRAMAVRLLRGQQCRFSPDFLLRG